MKDELSQPKWHFSKRLWGHWWTHRIPTTGRRSLYLGIPCELGGWEEGARGPSGTFSSCRGTCSGTGSCSGVKPGGCSAGGPSLESMLVGWWKHEIFAVGRCYFLLHPSSPFFLKIIMKVTTTRIINYDLNFVLFLNSFSFFPNTNKWGLHPKRCRRCGQGWLQGDGPWRWNLCCCFDPSWWCKKPLKRWIC